MQQLKEKKSNQNELVKNARNDKLNVFCLLFLSIANMATTQLNLFIEKGNRRQTLHNIKTTKQI